MLHENVPDPVRCKTRLVKEDLYYCVTREAYRCHFAIRLAGEYYCDHRDRRSFEAGTTSRGTPNDLI